MSPRRSHPRAPASTLLLIAGLFIGGCSSTNEKAGSVEPVYDDTTGRLQLLKYDSNGNGTIDTMGHMDGARVLRIEIDQDEDGIVDRWEHYGADGSLERVEISVRRNGKVARTEYYDASKLVRAEEDTNADGHIDKWDMYDGGRLVSVAFDTTSRGRPDRRLIYGPGGSAQLEVDPDGDSQWEKPREASPK